MRPNGSSAVVHVGRLMNIMPVSLVKTGPPRPKSESLAKATAASSSLTKEPLGGFRSLCRSWATRSAGEWSMPASSFPTTTQRTCSVAAQPPYSSFSTPIAKRPDRGRHRAGKRAELEDLRGQVEAGTQVEVATKNLQVIMRISS